MKKLNIIILTFLVNSSLMAENFGAKSKKLFTELKKDNLSILVDHYDRQATFIDPLGTHQGLDSITKYYKKLYDGVEEISFDYPKVIENNQTVVLF